MTVTEATDSVVVYVLAAPEDEELCGKIRKHLKPQVRTSELPIRLADDFEVPPAEDRAEYRKRLLDADVVLPLISVDLIDDDETYARSQVVLQRFNAGQNVMVSVIVRNCVLKNIPLAQPPVIVLPANRLPINSRKHWPDEDDAIATVAHEICDKIGEIVRAELAERAQSSDAGAPAAQQTQNQDVAPSSQGNVVEIDAPATSPDGDGAQPESTDRSGGAVAGGASVAAEGAAIRARDSAPAAAPAPPTPAAGEEATDATAQASVDWGPPLVQSSASAAVAATSPTKAELARPLEVDWRSKYYRRVVWKRCFAYLIDSVLFAYIPIIVIAALTSAVAGPDGDVPAAFSVATLPVLLFFPFGLPYLESRYLGTPGKRLLGLQITDRDGAPISYWRAFGRNFLRSITFYSYVLIVPLIYQRKRFRRTKKLFHDEWSKTVIGEHLRT